MQRQDFNEFASLVTTTLELYDKTMSEGAISIWWSALEQYPIQVVRSGLSAHVQNPERGRFAPKPADVIAAIHEHFARQWAGADEAWSLALQASDERNTVIWTEEAAKAFALASPILAEGDKVGARMAFKQAYERAVKAAVEARRAPQPLVSIGWDAKGRLDALEAAVASGALTHQQAEVHLISARREIGEDGKAVAGLITGKVIQHPSAPEATKRRLDELKRVIQAAPSFDSGKRAARDAKRKQEADAKAHARKIAEGAA